MVTQKQFVGTTRSGTALSVTQRRLVAVGCFLDGHTQKDEVGIQAKGLVALAAHVSVAGSQSGSGVATHWQLIGDDGVEGLGQQGLSLIAHQLPAGSQLPSHHLDWVVYFNRKESKKKEGNRNKALLNTPQSSSLLFDSSPSDKTSRSTTFIGPYLLTSHHRRITEDRC